MRKPTMRSLLIISVFIFCAFIVWTFYIIQGTTTKTWIHHKSNTYNRQRLAKNFSAENVEVTHYSNEQDCSTRDKNSNFFNDILDHAELVRIFIKKIAEIAPKRMNLHRPTCENHFKIANSCDNNTCLQTELPVNITARIAQLVTPCNLQLLPAEHKILRQIADEVVDNYDVILLTAASSNHFRESQALLKNLHENVYPYLKNFTLIFYNLGLTENEKSLMIKYCKCQVIDFPFHKFPYFINTLKCYAWKPVLIKSHLQKANVVFWMDASVRFHNSSMNLQKMIRKAKNRGIQVSVNLNQMSFRMKRSMFHFFGDEPCAYFHFGQIQATFGVYHREYFVDRVILEPWVACALNEDCMCPEKNISLSCKASKQMAKRYYQGKGPIVYGMCHRFDQSALGLILHKLYQDLYPWITVVSQSVLSVRRKHTINYFPENTDII